MWPLGIGLVILLALGLTASSKRAAPPVRSAEAEDEPPDMSAAELAASDPLEALRRYGTSADAARLAEQGVDLSALGYRPRSGER